MKASKQTLFALALIVVGLVAFASASRSSLKFVVDEDGTRTEAMEAAAAIGPAAEENTDIVNADTPLIHIHQDVAMYYDTSLYPGQNEHVLAVSEYNAPIMAAAFPLNPSSPSPTPLWEIEAHEPTWEHTAAFGIGVAGVDVTKGGVSTVAGFFGGAGNFTVRVEGLKDNGDMVWSNEYDNAQTDFMSLRPMTLSKDASTVAIALYVNVSMMKPGGAELSVLNAQTGDVKCHFVPDLAPKQRIYLPIFTQITKDGSFVLLNVGDVHYIVDVDQCKLRDEFETDYMAVENVYAISDDGDFVTIGFEKAEVYKFDDTTGKYSLYFEGDIGVSGFVESSTLDGSGTYLMSAFGTSADLLSKSIALWNVNTKSLVWQYDSKSTGNCQATTQTIKFSKSGRYVGLSSWGDCGDHSDPQITVFDLQSKSDSNKPIFKYVTPGSMFDADIIEAADGSVYVTAGGKACHANLMGAGGDFFLFKLNL